MGAKHWGRFEAGSRLWTATKAFAAPASATFRARFDRSDPRSRPTSIQSSTMSSGECLPRPARRARAAPRRAGRCWPLHAPRRPRPRALASCNALNTPSLTPRARSGQQGKAGGEAAKEKGGARPCAWAAPAPAASPPTHSHSLPATLPNSQPELWRTPQREFSCVFGRPVEAENILETNRPTNHSLITDHYPK